MRVRLTEKGREPGTKISELEGCHAKAARDDPAAMSRIEAAAGTPRRRERTRSDDLGHQAP